jgi:tRNA pseudouridine38-40 synthase
VGRHDFSSFESAGSERPDSIRTITELTVSHRFGTLLRLEGVQTISSNQSQKSRDPFCEHITIDVAGDGFLYNMVRAIVGTLVEVGRGTREIAWVAEVLAARDRRRAGQTAPPHGLFLVSVDYQSSAT